MRKKRFLMPIGFLAMVAGLSAIVMLLWNCLLPGIFGLGVINFWQSLGILVLCRILFGGFGGGHHRMHGAGFWMHGGNHIREKWMKMTPEQREEFINKRKQHFARGDFFGRRDFDFDTDENLPKDHE